MQFPGVILLLLSLMTLSVCFPQQPTNETSKTEHHPRWYDQQPKPTESTYSKLEQIVVSPSYKLVNNFERSEPQSSQIAFVEEKVSDLHFRRRRPAGVRKPVRFQESKNETVYSTRFGVEEIGNETGISLSNCSDVELRVGNTGSKRSPEPSIASQSNAQDINTACKNIQTTSEIVFPDGKSTLSFLPNEPCRSGSTFCEKTASNYPSGHISRILRNDAVFRGMFGQDMANDVINITQRIDFAMDEVPICPSMEQVVFPKQAKNKEDKWLFIVNEGEFTQGVRVEYCIKEGSCTFSEGFPAGYKAVCKQKYIYRKMLAISESGDPESDSFKLPSCCACFLKQTAATRMGTFLSKKNPMTPAISTTTRKN